MTYRSRFFDEVFSNVHIPAIAKVQYDPDPDVPGEAKKANPDFIDCASSSSLSASNPQINFVQLTWMKIQFYIP